MVYIIINGNGGNGGAGGVNPYLAGTNTYAQTDASLNWAGYGSDSSFYTNSQILSQIMPSSLLNYSGGGAGSGADWCSNNGNCHMGATGPGGAGIAGRVLVYVK